MNPIEEKLRILKPILQPKQWEYLRMSYAMEKDFKKRFQIENMIDLLIARHVSGLQMDQILLPPPDAKELSGCWRRRRRAKSGGVVPLRFVI